MLWFLFHGLLLFALAWIVWKKNTDSLGVIFWTAWLFKIITTLSAVFVHQQYYPDSDMLWFYKEAKALSDQAVNDFPSYFKFLVMPAEGYYSGEARSEFFIKLLSLFALFTRNDMVLMSLWLSMLPFYTTWYVVRILVKWKPELKWPAVIGFLFFPSAVFWTSGILKETVAMAGIYFIMAIFLKLWIGKRPGPWKYVLIIPSLWVAWQLKYYYVAVLLPVMFTSFITRYAGTKLLHFTVLREVLFFKFIFLLLLVLPGFFHPNLRPGRLIEVVAESHNRFLQHTETRHVTNSQITEPTVSGIIPHMLQGLANGLFGPWLPDFSNSFYMLSVIENWLLIVLSLFALAGLKIPATAEHRVLLWATLIYCVSLALWLGLAVPAAGTLVRYKAGFYSCWLALILHGVFHRLNRPGASLMK